MRIIVLDGYTLNPGDLSWEPLAELGELTVYERTPAESVVERMGDAEIALTNKTVLSAEILDQLPALRYIGVLATGYNVVDTQAARERNITVTNVPLYATQAVAQMVFAHLLHLSQHVAEHAQTVREGRWSRSVDFCYWDYPLIELQGRVMGIIGLGRIGRAVAALARAFGMQVLAFDAVRPDPVPEGVTLADTVEDVFRTADVLSLNCPLTADTEHLVNAERLALMKPTAFVINTSRGPLVDSAALAEALEAGRIAGAGLDVLETEPAAPDDPLIGAPNCFITPHIAWATRQARQRLLDTVVDNLKAFAAGKPINIVN